MLKRCSNDTLRTDGVVKRLAGRRIPHGERLALVGHADGCRTSSETTLHPTHVPFTSLGEIPCASSCLAVWLMHDSTEL